jgi:hypothetical protein
VACKAGAVLGRLGCVETTFSPSNPGEASVQIFDSACPGGTPSAKRVSPHRPTQHLTNRHQENRLTGLPRYGRCCSDSVGCKYDGFVAVRSDRTVRTDQIELVLSTAASMVRPSSAREPPSYPGMHTQLRLLPDHVPGAMCVGHIHPGPRRAATRLYLPPGYGTVICCMCSPQRVCSGGVCAPGMYE